MPTIEGFAQTSEEHIIYKTFGVGQVFSTRKETQNFTKHAKATLENEKIQKSMQIHS